MLSIYLSVSLYKYKHTKYYRILDHVSYGFKQLKDNNQVLTNYERILEGITHAFPWHRKTVIWRIKQLALIF